MRFPARYAYYCFSPAQRSVSGFFLILVANSTSRLVCQSPAANQGRRRFSLASASSPSRRSASDRDGASGCLSAHASTSSFSAEESRIGIVSPYLRPGGLPLFLCTLFSCFGIIFRVHKMQAGDKAATSPPALTQATEVSHGSG